jgi:hypothetical protein
MNIGTLAAFVDTAIFSDHKGPPGIIVPKVGKGRISWPEDRFNLEADGCVFTVELGFDRILTGCEVCRTD